uniref:spleen exonuclease n=1 Tax=Molossus molossus TaxID=27622 RepID=A0A7J8JYG5_MOLMO|nr:phospholipase D family member 4 [Molossus molossus]
MAPAPRRLVLVESSPQDMPFASGSPSAQPLAQAWLQLLDAAQESVHIASYYWSLTGSDIGVQDPSSQPGEALLQKLQQTLDRNVSLAVATSHPTLARNSTDLKMLAARGAQVRYVPMGHLTRGVLHSKFWVVDGRHVYLGSANMDWRSLTQVKELGAVISNCSRLARDLEKTFQTYWVLGAPKAVLPKHWPHNFSSHINHFQPLRAHFDGVPTTAYFSVRGTPRPTWSPAPPWTALQPPQRLLCPQGDSRGASALARLWPGGREIPAVPGGGPSSRDRWPGRCLGGLQTLCQVGSRAPAQDWGGWGSASSSVPLPLCGEGRKKVAGHAPQQMPFPQGLALQPGLSRDLVSGQGCGPRRGVALSRCEALPGTGDPAFSGKSGPAPPPTSPGSTCPAGSQTLEGGCTEGSQVLEPGVQNRGSALRDLSPKQASPPQLCPHGRTRDLDALLMVMREARQFIYASVMDYFPTTRFSHPARYWPVLDNALREVAFDRHVQVRLLVSCGLNTDPRMRPYLQSLQAFSNPAANISVDVKVFIVPVGNHSNIPFSRVNHSKFMVTEKAAYIGTSNWSEDYFSSTSGVGLVVSQRPPGAGPGVSTVQQQLRQLFERDWSSRYAVGLDRQAQDCTWKG